MVSQSSYIRIKSQFKVKLLFIKSMLLYTYKLNEGLSANLRDKRWDHIYCHNHQKINLKVSKLSW